MKYNWKQKSKSMLAFVLAFVMICSCAIDFIPASAETGMESLANLEIKASGFESSVSTYWKNAQRETTTVHTGSASAKVSSETTLAQSEILGKTAVAGGSMIRVGAYILTKDMEDSGSVSLAVNQFNSSGTHVATNTLQCFYGNSSGWYELAGVVHLESATTKIQIQFANNSTSGTLYVDDVFGSRYTAVTTGTDVNADFETVNTGGIHAFPSGWQMTGYGHHYVEGTLAVPQFYASSEHYHSGTRSLYLSRQSMDRDIAISNPNRIEVDPSQNLTYTWGMWIKSSDSDCNIRLDLNTYDAEGNKRENGTIIGNTVLLSRSKSLGEWQYVSTSATFPAEVQSVSYRIVLTDGKANVYIDDLFCKATETMSEKLVDWSDFHAVTESGEVAGWDYSGEGAFSATGQVATLINGRISRTIEEILPGYTYELTAYYTASKATDLSITYYDLKGSVIRGDKKALAAASTETKAVLEFEVPEGSYLGVVSIGGDGTYTLSNFKVFETGKPAGASDWTANWVWYPEKASANSKRYRFFRYHFTVETGKEVERAYLQVAADDMVQELYLDGTYLGSGSQETYREEGKKSVTIYSLPKSKLTAGEHVIAVAVWNESSHAGLIFEGEIQYTDDTATAMASGVHGTTLVSTLGCDTAVDDRITYYNNITENWEAASYDDSSWQRARTLGVPPAGNLGKVAYSYKYTNRLNIHIDTQEVSDVTAGDKLTLTADASYPGDNLYTNGKFVLSDSVSIGQSNFAMKTAFSDQKLSWALGDTGKDNSADTVLTWKVEEDADYGNILTVSGIGTAMSSTYWMRHDITWTAGKTYTISYMAKTGSESVRYFAPRVNGSFAGTSGTEAPPSNTKIESSVVNEWTKYSFEITATETKAGVLWFGYQLTSTNQTVSIANVRVTETDTETDTPDYTEEEQQMSAKLFYKGTDKAVAHVPLTFSYQDGSVNKVQLAFDVPDYLSTGEYELRVEQKYLQLYENETNRLALLNVTQKDAELLNVEVRKEKQTTGLYINDKKASPVMYLKSSDYNYTAMSEMSKSGITLYGTFDAALSAEGDAAIWTDNDNNGNPVINYQAFDYEILRTLDSNPNAYVMVYLNVDAPDWWKAENPDELIATQTGSTDLTSNYNSKPQVSMASTKYSKEAAQVVTLLMQHMKSSGYAHRVFGVRISAGTTAEWMSYGGGAGTMIDYSSAAENEFRNYLKKIYGTDSALQTAWGNASVTLSGATIPTTDERNASEAVTVLDLTTRRNVVDYNNFLGQIRSDRLLEYAAAVKGVCSNWIVGAYNGYLWYHTSSDGIGNAHTAVSDVLDSEYIDFISAPANYSERIAGYSTGYMGMSDSIMAHGKLYMIEQDNRTLGNGAVGDASSDNGRGLSSTVKESVQQLTRDMVFDYVRGSGFWLYDMGGGWFDDESIYQRVKAIKTEYDNEFTVNSNNEIALFVAEQSFNYLKGDCIKGVQHTQYLMSTLYREQRRELSFIGASYDSYTIEDLCEGLVEQDYKVNLILSPFELSDEQRNSIDAKLKRDGKTVIWVYMSGASNGGAYTSENVSALTDIDVTLVNGTRPLQATVSESAGSICGTEAVGTVYGSTNPASGPYAYVNENGVTTLATYANGQIAAAYKEVADGEKNYTSIYSAVPDLSAEMLRGICENAGVHLYSQDASDIIETNENYVALYSAVGGEKTISLPDVTGAIYSVYDVLAEEEVTVDGNTITYTHEAGDTKLLRISCTVNEFKWNGGMITNPSFREWNDKTGLPVGYDKNDNGKAAKIVDSVMGTAVRLTGVSISLEQKLAVEPGKTYTVSFRCKYSGSGYPLVQIYNNGASGRTEHRVQITQDGSWQYYQFRYTPEADVTQARLRVRIAGGAADTVMDVTNLYFDEYRGGLLKNGDFRLIDKSTGKPSDWIYAGTSELSYSEEDGHYRMNLVGAKGPTITDTVSMEANTTYIARFSAKISAEATGMLRIYEGSELKHIFYPKAGEEGAYKYPLSSVTAAERQFRFVLASANATETTTFSIANASLVKNVGDFNEDGITDGEDKSLMRQFLLGTANTDDYSDLTADGAVGVQDLVRILKYAAE